MKRSLNPSGVTWMETAVTRRLCHPSGIVVSWGVALYKYASPNGERGRHAVECFAFASAVRTARRTDDVPDAIRALQLSPEQRQC